MARCAFERRRSAAALVNASTVSGKLQKAAMEMRGTGRSFGAAPKLSRTVGVSDSLVILRSSFAPVGVAGLDVRDPARLLFLFFGNGGFALAVFVEHGQ